MIVNRLISEILFGFTGLIGIINPIGIAFLFLERTEALTEHERDLLARKVAFNAFVVLMVAFSLVTALVLNRKILGRGFWRGVYFYPVLLSPVVVALIWKWLLQREGVLNKTECKGF